MNKIALGLLALILFFSCSHPVDKVEEDNTDSEPQLITASAETFITELPNEISEISGLLIWKDLFWGFNDSGGDPILFGFDSTGTIQMQIELVNAVNNDWESITQDENYLYVGDFGNNSGSRENLCIYKISKEDISDQAVQQVNAEKLDIQYASQTDFGYSVFSTAYDCEAMAEFNGKLYLFSKNWSKYISEVYRLSPEPGSYNLEAIDTLDVNMMVTGADISVDKTKLALIGYLDFHTYLWVFSNFKNDDFKSGKKVYINLNNIDGAQTEGIYFLNNDTLLISCEKTSGFNQQVFLFNLKDVENGTR